MRRRRRYTKKKKYSGPNPEIVKHLSGIIRNCRKYHQENKERTYRRALNSVEAHPDKIRNADDAKKLKWIGNKIAKVIGDFINDSDDVDDPTDTPGSDEDIASPMLTTRPSTRVFRNSNRNNKKDKSKSKSKKTATTTKKKRKKRKYKPRYRSAPWAIMIVLYKHYRESRNVVTGSGLFLNRQDVIKECEPFTDTEMESANYQDHYSGWSSMNSTLVKKHNLVVRKWVKKRKMWGFGLSKKGMKMGKDLWRAMKKMKGEECSEDSEESDDDDDEEEEEEEKEKVEVKKKKRRKKKKEKVKEREEEEVILLDEGMSFLEKIERENKKEKRKKKERKRGERERKKKEKEKRRKEKERRKKKKKKKEASFDESEDESTQEVDESTQEVIIISDNEGSKKDDEERSGNNEKNSDIFDFNEKDEDENEIRSPPKIRSPPVIRSPPEIRSPPKNNNTSIEPIVIDSSSEEEKEEILEKEITKDSVEKREEVDSRDKRKTGKKRKRRVSPPPNIDSTTTTPEPPHKRRKLNERGVEEKRKVEVKITVEEAIYIYPGDNIGPFHKTEAKDEAAVDVDIVEGLRFRIMVKLRLSRNVDPEKLNYPLGFSRTDEKKIALSGGEYEIQVSGWMNDGQASDSSYDLMRHWCNFFRDSEILIDEEDISGREDEMVDDSILYENLDGGFVTQEEKEDRIVEKIHKPVDPFDGSEFRITFDNFLLDKDSEEDIIIENPKKNRMVGNLGADYDIFLLLDSRERKNVIRKGSDYMVKSFQRGGVNVRVEVLGLGDMLWIARNCENGKESVLNYIIERKYVDDLAGSLMDGRYNEQRFRLQQSGMKHAHYLIEGKYNQQRSMAVHSLQQAEVNLGLSKGIRIIRTNGVDETIEKLTLITKFIEKEVAKRGIEDFLYDGKELEIKEFNETWRKNKNVSVREVFGRQLCCLRGVSMEKAGAILQKHSTPKMLMDKYYRSSLSKKDKMGLLSDIQLSTPGIENINTRRVGPAVSKLIYKIFN